MTGKATGVAGHDATAQPGPAPFQAIFEASPDAICIVADGTVARANANAATLLGYPSPEALVGTRLARHVDAPRRRLFTALLARAAAGGAARPLEAAWQRQDGSSFDAECTLARVPGRDKDAVQLCIRDITGRRRAVEALREESRRKDTFLAVVAHELRNPLAPLRAGLDVARLAPEHDPRTADALAIMDRQLHHLSALVDDLLDVTRIGNGQLALTRAPTELADVLYDSVDGTREAFRERRHVLDIDIAPPANHRVLGDFERLVQVFTNLLLNAAKYTPPGGAVAVRVEHAGRHEIVTVRDNGKGIAPADLARLFEPFERCHDDAHAARCGSMGIGLAVARQLVALHGGRIEAESAGPGHGSVFRVSLPALAATAEAAADAAGPHPEGPASPMGETPPAAQPTPNGDARAARRRIVVADDDEDVLQALAMLLDTLGHQVWLARSGSQAIAQSLAVQPDLLLLDLSMPDIGGIEVARRLRATVGGDDLRIGALTGHCQPTDHERTRAAGFDWHFRKPVTGAALNEVLARLPARDSDSGPAAA